eukprot:746431-Hanusia_phi.AAC.3
MDPTLYPLIPPLVPIERMRLVLGLALLCLTSPVLPATSLPALPRPPLALFHSDLSSAPVSDPFRHDLLGSSCYFPQGELQDWDAGMLLAAGQTSPVPKQQNVFATLPPITIAALSTATLMYPVDLVRALRMSAAAEGHAKPTVELLQNFYREHGLKGFATQGVVPEMVRATYMRILKFFLFPIVHEGIFKKSEKDGTGLTKAVAGAIASVPEAITIQPIEISKIALQLDKNNVYKNNAFSVIKDIIKTRGWPGLYAGFPGLQYRQLSWTAAYFASLRHFQEQSSHIIPDDMKMLQQFAGGFAAGIFGAVGCDPLGETKNISGFSAETGSLFVCNLLKGLAPFGRYWCNHCPAERPDWTLHWVRFQGSPLGRKWRAACIISSHPQNMDGCRMIY